jgi:hypothetical protein
MIYSCLLMPAALLMLLTENPVNKKCIRRAVPANFPDFI